MKRPQGERYQSNGLGLKNITPHHSARLGVFPYVASQSDREHKASIVARMQERIAQKPSLHEDHERRVEDVKLGNVELPSFNKKSEIIDSVVSNQVTVVVGPTGSGKSTQVPQFLLEAGFNKISVTQPRIMAANGVGDRIADELETTLGEDARQLVAVQSSERFDSQLEARIFIRTDGLEQILQLESYLMRLSEEEAEAVSSGMALVIDEVHESNVNQVGLLALSKRMLGNYPDLRVVVMSATADVEKYSNYFSDQKSRDVGIVEIEGQPADLEWQERPDKDAIEMMQDLLEGGSNLEAGDEILLFTSGKNEINTLIKKGIASGLPLEFAKLHAGMTTQEQARSLSEHEETIRVIVATDVAMTSLTFPRVKYVIDEGVVKSPELDEEAAEGLVPQPCSQAEIRQRGGRAGRVQPGVHITVRPHEECGQQFMTFEDRSKYPAPPIYSTDLSRNILLFANYGVDFGDLDLIDPVSNHSIRQAKDKLYNLGALDEDDQVTSIGKMMNKFPVGTEYSRMIAEAMRPGVPLNALVNTIIVAATYEAGGLRSFVSGQVKGKEPWQNIASRAQDDPSLEIAMFSAAGLEGGEKQLRELALKGYDLKNLIRARKAYRKCMRAVGLDPFSTPILPLDGDENDTVRHCVASGLVENIYLRSRTAQRNGRHKYYPSTGFGLPREVSSRSVIDSGQTKMLVGMPRFYIAQTKMGPEKYDIIEKNQLITDDELRKLDVRETVVAIDTVAQNGMLKLVKERRFGNISRGAETVNPQAGEIDEGVVLKAVLENPGLNQNMLKDIKRNLEGLQQLTRRRVVQLDQVRYEGLLLQAVRRSGSTEFHMIDNTLGEIMREQGVRMEGYIAPAYAEEIRQAAVESLELNGEIIPLDYRQGQPLALHVSPQTIEQLPDHVAIPDGREVLFRVPKLSERGGRVVRGYHDLPAHEAKRVVQRAAALLDR